MKRRIEVAAYIPGLRGPGKHVRRIVTEGAALDRLLAKWAEQGAMNLAFRDAEDQ